MKRIANGFLLLFLLKLSFLLYSFNLCDFFLLCTVMGGAYVNINGTRTANKTKPTEVENMKWTLHLLRNYLFWIILSFIYIFSDFVVAVFIIYHFNKAYNVSFFCSFVCAFDTSLPTLEPLVILPLYERYPNFSYLVQKFTFIVF